MVNFKRLCEFYLTKWWAQLGLNQRPNDYESSALTN